MQDDGEESELLTFDESGVDVERGEMVSFFRCELPAFELSSHGVTPVVDDEDILRGIVSFILRKM